MIATILLEAWRAMGANRLRTFLTMLGMIIGVGAVVLMLAIGEGAQTVMRQTISTLGSNLFIVLSSFTTNAGVRSGTGQTPTLTLGDARALAELDTVAGGGTSPIASILAPKMAVGLTGGEILLIAWIATLIAGVFMYGIYKNRKVRFRGKKVPPEMILEVD